MEITSIGIIYIGFFGMLWLVSFGLSVSQYFKANAVIKRLEEKEREFDARLYGDTGTPNLEEIHYIDPDY